jgi:hypothetical protein
MDNSWKGLEPSPIEFMHGRLMDEFHKFRKSKTQDVNVLMNGIDFASIVVAAKVETYERYKALELHKAVPETALKGVSHE